MIRPCPTPAVLTILLLLMISAIPPEGSAMPLSDSVRAADAALDRALDELVSMPGGPPGAIALVQRELRSPCMPPG